MEDNARNALHGLVPGHMHGGITLWIDHGIPPGGFMTAVLCNDLHDAMGRADEINRARIFDIVSWLHNFAPRDCWGCREAMAAWVQMHEENRLALEATEESDA